MATVAHLFYLEELCKRENLRAIGESPKSIEAIFIEPQWFANGKPLMVPDMFIRYANGNWVVVELKGSRKKRARALEQIKSGKKMVKKLFHAKNVRGKFVTYHAHKGYRAEDV